ncbi:SMP-30/gluconolactonase/LRE family protein [Antrihabitans sp. YC2-6]|uniref:SMP-30/gluconolactonase/LRE family protein n=1 Tax=Antrihabitans sp. YC2-6 TaxID=2799498 RepID=UPI0018F3CF72|nr:SMP-30/gluconolactonase/LRE family protein [Antrihabitans sp. YC2-6]MBJ8348872.1 SMP-30/gluconolactonase/LRE family protein [Antrihabitans sp. YC2-6]
MSEILLTGLRIGESARWHDGRLWLSNWGTQQVLAVDLDGNSEVMATVPTTLPFSIDWLPDGRLLIVSGPEGRLLRQEPDGSLVDHIDLSTLQATFNEIVVDGRGNIYINGGNDFHPDAGEAPGFIALITADGTVRRVADKIDFPNGMAITPDNSTLIIAESFAQTLTAFDIGADGGLSNRRVWAPISGDGIVLDSDGAVWTPGWSDSGPACVRVAEGGEVLATIPLDRAGFACTLGGEDGRTLFMLSAEWRMADGFEDNVDRLITGPCTGQVTTARAPFPHAGRP